MIIVSIAKTIQTAFLLMGKAILAHPIIAVIVVIIAAIILLYNHWNEVVAFFKKITGAEQKKDKSKSLLGLKKMKR